MTWMPVGLAAWAAIGLATGPEVESLIGQLGSNRYADREAASRALEGLGPRAFPALKAARSDRDPEVKSRAEALLDLIERSLLTRPASIPLDGRATTFGAVIDAIGDAEGVSIGLGEGVDGRKTSPLSGRGHAQVVTFWQAMDRLALTPVWEAEAEFGRPSFRRTTTLKVIPRALPAPITSDSGPFRTSVQTLVYAPEIAAFDGFPRPAGEAAARRGPREMDLVVQLEVSAEPRLSLRPAGSIKLFEATDDRGQALNLSSRGPGAADNLVPGAEQSVPTLQQLLRLKPPARVGMTLKRLRGAIPVQVEARRIDPTVIPLSNAATAEKRPVNCGGVILTVHALLPQTRRFSGGYQIDMTIRTEGWVGPQGRFGQRRQWEWMNSEGERVWQNLEIVDAQGRTLRAGPSRPVASDNEGVRVLLDVTAGDDNQPPAEIRYYGMIRTNLDIPFDFADLKLP